MWTWRRFAERVLLLGLLSGCSAEYEAGFGFDQDPIADVPDLADVADVADMEVDAVVCPPGQIAENNRCEPLPADVCPLVDALGLDCADRDGDCFVAGCTGAPDALVDCDDGRADAWPGAEELCDEIDNDCDALTDEGFDLGFVCEACGSGQLECSLTDARRAVCSTTQGQSQAPPPAPELCNGLDDDCDERIDESCRLGLPPLTRSAPVLCGEHFLVVEGDVLVRRSLAGGEPEVISPTPVRWPACDGDLLAWIAPDPAHACLGEGPARCPQARLFARFGDQPPEDLTGLADLGPPVVTGGAVYWHSVLGAGPVLQRRVPGGPIEPLFAGSDPSRRFGDLIAVRSFEGEFPRVELRGLDGGRDLRVEGPNAPAGPPALDENWLVWRVEGGLPALWAVPRERVREGFQVTTTGAPRGRPWLDQGQLWWLDTDGLRRFDLNTGETGVLPGLRDPEQLDVRDGRVLWVEGDDLSLFSLPQPQ